MATAATSCSCGCSSMTSLTAAEPCGCGCSCCGEATRTKEQEVAELVTLRQAIDKRLAELEPDRAGA